MHGQGIPALDLGRYRVIEEIARGTDGVVYRARDPVIDRLVTLKTVDIGMPRSEYEAWQRRVDRELKSAGRLNHPNIVTIYDVGMSGDIAYVAMEHMDGRSLREMLDTGVVLSAARVADIAAQVADGLAFVHQRGIVHRDIKPDHLMVLRNGGVKITDFGIARPSRGAHTRIAEVVASPRYTSPEQVVGDSVDERSDIFSLGAVLYEMLARAPPFASGRLHEIAEQIVHKMPAAPSTRNPHVSAAFDAIVAKAMAKRPRDRYRNAAEMAAEIRLAVQAAHRPADDEAAAALPLHSAPSIVGDANVLPVVTQDIEYFEVPPLAGAPALSSARDGHRRRPFVRYVVPAVLLAVASGAMIAQWPAEPVRGNGSSDVLPVARSEESPVAFGRVDGESSNPPPAIQAEPSISPAPTGLAREGPFPPSKSANRMTPTPSGLAEEAPGPPSKNTIRLAMAISPWGEVYVDGQRKGVSPPLTELRLAPGKHTIEIRNTTFPPYRESVDLRGASNLKLRHNFE